MAKKKVAYCLYQNLFADLGLLALTWGCIKNTLNVHVKVLYTTIKIWTQIIIMIRFSFICGKIIKILQQVKVRAFEDNNI